MRKERSDGTAIAALVRQSRQRQVRIPLQDTGKPAEASCIHWRKRRDSNPRGLSPKRFSRPPRYDHFDTLPCATIIARFACGFNNMNIFAPDLFVFRGTEEMHFTLRLLAAVATGCTYATEGRRGRFACPCNNDGRQRRRLRLRAAVRRGGRKVVGGRRHASVINTREFFAASVHLSCLRLRVGVFVEVGGSSYGYCALQTLFEKFAAVCIVAVD